jgi:gas vesicle protein
MKRRGSPLYGYEYPTNHLKEKGLAMDTKNKKHGFTDQPNGIKSLLTGLLFGGILGAGTMLFFAPQSGSKTRAEVQRRAAQLRENTSEAVMDRVEQARFKTGQIKADVKSKAADLEHKGRVLLARGLGNVSQVARAGKKAIQSP